MLQSIKLFVLQGFVPQAAPLHPWAWLCPQARGRCGSAAEQGCAAQPRGVQPSPGCSVPHGRRVGEQFSWPLCLTQTLLGAPSLGTAPWPCADTQLPTTHTHPGVLPHQGGAAAPVCWGAGREARDPGEARGPRSEPGWRQPLLSSPAQLRAPRAQRRSPLHHHPYTRVDTCTNTRQ